MRRHIAPFVGTIALAIWLGGCASAGPSAVTTVSRAPSALPSGWSAAAGPASSEVIGVLEGRLAAYNRGDFAQAAAYWADDGSLIEYEDQPIHSKGREAIADRLEGVYRVGVRMEPAGTPLQFGRLVSEPVRFVAPPGTSAYGEGMLVFEFDADGKIRTEWVAFWLRPS